MAGDLPSASLLENVQFNQTVILPNALQGLFRRRPAAVAVATRLDVDGWAVGLLARLRRNHGPGPVWVRVIRDRALLLLSVEDVRRALEGSPDPFASDPEAKRRGMGHFQPDALTLSRGVLWANRRGFADAVLEPATAVHRLGDHFVAIVEAEVTALLAEIDGEAGAVLSYEAFHRMFRRIVRRIVLGDGARTDERVSDLLGQLMSEANGLPGERSEHYEPFMERISGYVAAAEDGSLVGLFGDAPHDADTRVEGQVIHWLFAMQDTLAANSLRALALVAAHPEQRARAERDLAGVDLTSAVGLADLAYLRACLQEAMRLYPTTPLLSRETVVDLTWHGAIVPAGTQVLIANVFLHRDPDRVAYADQFSPHAWADGEAAEDWGFNHFSHGPQGCPGVNLSLLVGSAVLAQLLRRRNVETLEPTLDPARPLPHMFDYFRIRLGLAERRTSTAVV
jgi:cytochrome P450